MRTVDGMRLVAIAVLAAAPAFAGNVSNEVSVARSQQTDASPRAGNVADALNASFDLGDQWAFHAGALLTVEGQTPAAERGAFGSSASAVMLFSLGLDYEPSDHVTLGLQADWSPQSTQHSGTTLQLRDATNKDVSADALLKVVSSQGALGLDLSYDTAGESDVEWSFGGGLTLTHFSTVQNIERVRTASGVATKQQIETYCSATNKCSKALLKTLQETPADLNSLRLSADVVATLWNDTDVGLSGDYYAYNEDPTQVGYFSVGAAGRQTIGGNGIPIAPMRYLVRPEVAHRFGDFSAKLWVQAGHYVESAGGGTAGGGLKFQYKFSKAFKMWLTLSGQSDIDDQGNTSKAGTVALGGGYRF